MQYHCHIWKFTFVHLGVNPGISDTDSVIIEIFVQGIDILYIIAALVHYKGKQNYVP